MNAEAGALLADIREAAGMTQKGLAAKIGANQTRISRIESGDGELNDFVAYLSALGTEKANALIHSLKMEWRHLQRPSLRHPDLSILTEIEGALDRVNKLLSDENLPIILAGQAQLLLARLKQSGEYLLALNHDVVYAGEIGAGKSTAACAQSGLVIDPQNPTDLKGMLLDTAGGRTTLCDVRVETGESFTISVDPVPDEEIYKLVAELCRGISEKITGELGSTQAEFKPPEEIERALRNMAGLPRPPRPRKAPALPDPAVDLARQLSSTELFSAEFAAKLGLWRRKRRIIEFDGIDPSAGRLWLKSTFVDLNNGRLNDFSLPARINVTVPFNLSIGTQLTLSVVDTRGVDGSAIRPDILSHIKNERAVTILCSKWGSAPDPSLQDLLRHITETDADRSLLTRIAIVALAHGGDALSMRHDSGASAEDTQDGYDIKLGQVDDALLRIGMPTIDTFAYNAGADDPAEFLRFIIDKLNSVRKSQALDAQATIEAIDQLLSNMQQAQALAAVEEVSGDLHRFSNRHAEFPIAVRPAYSRLLAAVRRLHARTVWATTRRSGRFWNFDVLQYLGDGAAAEAKIESSAIVRSLQEIIQLKHDNPEFESAYRFLEQIFTNAPKWEADFVNAIRHHAIAIYSEPLTKAQELWDKCEAPYGTASGNYREHVSGTLDDWFNQNRSLYSELVHRTQRAWDTTFIGPLRQAAGQTAHSGGT